MGMNCQSLVPLQLCLPMSEDTPEHRARLPGGLFTALVCAALMITAFAVATVGIRMPSNERWSALTTFTILALGYTLQGSPELYDVLGRIVRRDIRALTVLLLLIPVLYLSYGAAVNDFTWPGLLTTLAFVGLPALVFDQSGHQRTPTLFDLIAALYLLTSLALHLLPVLSLPQQGGLVDFFTLSVAPLLLLLLAARGWPGLGFTWFISSSDLRLALLGAAGLLVALVPLAILLDMAYPAVEASPVLNTLVGAVLTYFLVALPQELFFRGFVQNGIERFLESKLWRGPGSFTSARGSDRLLQPRIIALLCSAMLSGAAYFNPMSYLHSNLLLTIIASLGYGWIYQRTGKVTVSAITHMLVVWCWAFFF